MSLSQPQVTSIVASSTLPDHYTYSGIDVVLLPKPDNRVKSRAPRRSGLALVAGLCLLAVALFGCGTVKGARGVSLVPNEARNKTWQWTAVCLLGPSVLRGCAKSGPNLESAQLNADIWNLGGGKATAGSVKMSTDASGALTVAGNLPSAPPCTESTCIAPSANTWVRGYPSVLYGMNQCSAKTSPPLSQDLGLPARVSSIPPDLIGTTTYSSHTSSVTYDIAYDMWLNNSDTKTPCKQDGTIEIMVWTDYGNGALLPGSVKNASASVPYTVNGVSHSGTDAWSVYVSNVFGQGHTQPWGGTLYFILNRADTVKHGTVSVDLSSVLSDAGALLQRNYGWSNFAKNYWLDTIPFGIEFGPPGASPYGAGSSDFSLRMSSFCLSVRTTVSVASCDGLHRQ